MKRSNESTRISAFLHALYYKVVTGQQVTIRSLSKIYSIDNDTHTALMTMGILKKSGSRKNYKYSWVGVAPNDVMVKEVISINREKRKQRYLKIKEKAETCCSMDKGSITFFEFLPTHTEASNGRNTKAVETPLHELTTHEAFLEEKRSQLEKDIKQLIENNAWLIEKIKTLEVLLVKVCNSLDSSDGIADKINHLYNSLK